MEWTLFQEEGIWAIHTFDDGNGDYAKEPNTWCIVGRWAGKVRLRNSVSACVVQSISEWKVARA